jgi:signal transduction histidine kinase
LITEINKSLKRLNQYLQQEVAVLTAQEKVYLILGTGVFVFLFMVFFQPFGVNNYDPTESINWQLVMALSVFSFFMSVGFAFTELLLYSFVIKTPTRLRLALWVAFTICWLAFCAFLIYNYLGEWHDWRLSSYFEFIGNIGALLLLPLTAAVVYLHMRSLHASLELAYKYGNDDGDQLLVLTAENQKDQFTIPMKLLVFIESDDNYISIHHLKNEQLTKMLFRKSLKSVQEDAKHPALIRCHRSYMVNLMHVEQLHGNRNKLEIHLTNVKESIPVSRQYIDDVYKLIKK